MTTINSNQLFPNKFLTKQANFSNITLTKVFLLWKQAIISFTSKNMIDIDPLVCENACHIRAFVLNDLLQKYSRDNKICRFITYVDSIDYLVTKTLNVNIKEKDESIESYLNKESLFFDIDESMIFDLKFIIYSYILTLTKIELPSDNFALNEKTCHTKILETGLVHSKVKCLVSSTQKELSAMSCQYIKEKASIINNAGISILLDIKQDSHLRSYLPQLITAKVIMQSILGHNQVIIIKVNRYIRNQFLDTIICAYEPNQDKTDFCSISSLSEVKPCVVFSGVCNYEGIPETQDKYKYRLEQNSILSVILSNLAAHPQFSGNLRFQNCIYEEKIVLLTEEKKKQELDLVLKEYFHYTEMKDISKKIGCCIENPSLLFLNHIYCEMTSRFMQLDKDRTIISRNNFTKVNVTSATT
ncbi:MAG: hypothetical protein P1U74_11340 [Legionellaceae bacterium]|nr:hypothetical protein [Legionellaceae bacterium]